LARLSVALVVSFYVAFAVFSVKVKRDVARAEAFDTFGGGLPRGHAPPAFELPDLEGASFALDREVESGELVVVKFWATWCRPCRLELPMLDDLNERYRDAGLRILAIDVGEDRDTVEAFLRERPVSFPVLMDTDRAVATRYRIEAFPTTILVDREGNVVDVTEGLDPYLGYRIEAHLETAEADAEAF